MPNPVFTNILMVCKLIWYIHFSWVLSSFLSSVKQFQVFRSNVNMSIYNLSFVCVQFNGFKYCYVSLTIQLNNHLFTQQHLIKFMISIDYIFKGTLAIFQKLNVFDYFSQIGIFSFTINRLLVSFAFFV